MTARSKRIVILSNLGALAISVSAAAAMGGCSSPSRPAGYPAGHRVPPAVTVCELLKNVLSYRDKLIAVRGIYWYGLRQSCSEQFVTGTHVWPTALNFWYSDDAAKNRLDTSSEVNLKGWGELEATVKREAKAGHREEIWVTLIGMLRAPESYIRTDGQIVGGYGHLGGFPAEVVVESVSDIEIKPVPTYDYAELLRHPVR